LFGAKVSNDFISKIERKVMLLPQMPDIHPKNRTFASLNFPLYYCFFQDDVVPLPV
jgi:hypothetical protein